MSNYTKNFYSGDQVGDNNTFVRRLNAKGAQLFFCHIQHKGELLGSRTTVTSAPYRSQRKFWPRLAINIYLRFQLYTAVQVVHSSTQCELREGSVCVLGLPFIDQVCYILFKRFSFWEQMRFEWLLYSLSIYRNCDVTQTPWCLPTSISLYRHISQQSNLLCSDKIHSTPPKDSGDKTNFVQSPRTLTLTRLHPHWFHEERLKVLQIKFLETTMPLKYEVGKVWQAKTVGIYTSSRQQIYVHNFC